MTVSFASSSKSSTISVMVMVPEFSPALIVIDSLAKVKSLPEPVAVPVTAKLTVISLLEIVERLTAIA